MDTKDIIEKIRKSNTITEDHLRDTNNRVEKAFSEMLSGYDYKLDMRKFPTCSDDIIVKSQIPISYLCPHHLLPVVGYAYFAYIPDKYMCGISKIIRLIQGKSKVAMCQEDLGPYLLDEFERQLKPKGCVILLDCIHSCELVRGVGEKCTTTTLSSRGLFREKPELELKFLSLIHKKDF